MPGACMTCMAMYMNGAVIGMVTTQTPLKPILMDRFQGLVACFVAVAGPVELAVAGRRTVVSAIQATATTSLASALFLPSKQGYFHSSF